MARKSRKEKGLKMAEIYELQEVEVWDGNMAASHAMRHAQIDVVSANPLTPSTPRGLT